MSGMFSSTTHTQAQDMRTRAVSSSPELLQNLNLKLEEITDRNSLALLNLISKPLLCSTF